MHDPAHPFPRHGSGNWSADASWAPDEALRQEMARLEAGLHASPAPHERARGEPLAKDPSAGFPDLPPWNAAPPAPADERDSGLAVSDLVDTRLLLAENAEMRALIQEMRQIFEQATVQEEENARLIAQLQQENAGLRDQHAAKDDQITLLTSQIHELEEHLTRQEQTAAPAAPAPPPGEDELSRLADELERERCQLARHQKDIEEERQQLREDEEGLMKQMREMEVQMAKDRAELARQRTELQRLHNDLQVELEQMQRGDKALSDRLSSFNRRHQAVFEPANGVNAAPAVPAAAPRPTPPAPNGQPGQRDSSGLIRRLFGRS